ncbi:MAG TPA: hypothetical protein VFU61_06970, partial [Steroidobacteraceae bacterium]|nr:hypothetical protein [Steroidobacteraceae bacterium]
MSSLNESPGAIARRHPCGSAFGSPDGVQSCSWQLCNDGAQRRARRAEAQDGPSNGTGSPRSPADGKPVRVAHIHVCNVRRAMLDDAERRAHEFLEP